MVYDSKEFISRKIKNARMKSGLTQEQLAEKIGIGSQQVSSLESGKYAPSFETFLRIAEVLNLTLKDFGIDTHNQENKMLDELIKLMHTLNDTEIECCYNVMQALVTNFEILKKSKIKKNA